MDNRDSFRDSFWDSSGYNAGLVTNSLQVQIPPSPKIFLNEVHRLSRLMEKMWKYLTPRVGFELTTSRLQGQILNHYTMELLLKCDVFTFHSKFKFKYLMVWYSGHDKPEISQGYTSRWNVNGNWHQSKHSPKHNLWSVGKLAVHQYLQVQFDAAVDPCTELVECPVAQLVQEVSVVVPVLYWSAGHCVQVPPFI